MHDWDKLGKANHHGLIHNPGFDFLRMVKWLQEEENSPGQLAPYSLPILALIAGCCSIEGYVGYVGSQVVDEWVSVVKGPVPIRERIEMLYSALDLSPDFAKVCLRDVTELFAMRIQLVHPTFVCEYKKQKKTHRNIFDKASKQYPFDRTRKIVEELRDKLLKDFGLEDVWWERSLNVAPAVELSGAAEQETDPAQPDT